MSIEGVYEFAVVCDRLRNIDVNCFGILEIAL